MSIGALWALVAALGFAVLQVSNRKVNQRVDALRTAFGLLLAVEVTLIGRGLVAGTLGGAMDMPIAAAGYFSLAAFLHFVGGWTLLGLSQQQIGVARTGALVSAAPIMGTLVAAVGLDEPLNARVLGGVLLATGGIALISTSGPASGEGSAWRRPWLALSVAVIWGTTPFWIRLGLREFDQPITGLTVGLGVSVAVFALLLLGKGRRRSVISQSTRRWLLIGGVSGALAVSAQWLSYDLTTVAIAITVQQLSVLFVIALVPLMFDEPLERMTARFFAGALALVAGAVLVVAS